MKPPIGKPCRTQSRVSINSFTINENENVFTSSKFTQKKLITISIK